MRPSDFRLNHKSTIPPLLFLIGFGVRLLSRHDTLHEVGKVQPSVTANYKHLGRLLYEGGVGSFFDPSSPASDPNLLGHPPGYSFLWALVLGLFGESDAGLQFLQIACDAAAAAVVFLIAVELLPAGVAVIAGLLVALAPQFTWNSVLLLPDTLAVLPILLSVYCIVRAYKRPRAATLVAAGVFVGLSCWLRANALLLAPFLCLLIPVLFGRGVRLRLAAALLCGTVVIIAPLTIRNAVVFGHFIPVSLGAGQTMLEGIADYDPEGKFGIPPTDLRIMRQEAELFSRPDYAETLFGPDAIKRERRRLARAFEVIRSHPLWFAGVMARRAASMLRLERARLIAADPPVTHALPEQGEAEPMWSLAPGETVASGAVVAPGATASLSPDATYLHFTGDDSKRGEQIVFPPVAVREDTDYLFALPVKLEQSRLLIEVTSADRAPSSASLIVDTVEGKKPAEQPVQTLRLPFVSRRSEEVRVVLRNAAATRPVAQVGALQLFELGPARYLWTRLPRMLVRGLQHLFLTAVALPLVILGVVVLARDSSWRVLAILCAVPAYYFCVQSAVHTEYRYVLAVHYFLFIIAATALYRLGAWLRPSRLRAQAEGRRRGQEAEKKSQV